MASRVSFDLNELWQDFKGIVAENWMLLTDPREAPPTIRTPDAAFMAILDHRNRSVGTFVPELYELAKVDGLIAQQAEAAWLKTHRRAPLSAKKAQDFYKVLYNEDGSKKTPFELALLPVIYTDANKKSARAIQKRVEDEFINRIEKGQALPQVVYKYQIKSDYLRDLHKLNLKTGGPRAIKLNLILPANETTIPDRVVHYTAQRTAFLTTFLAGFAALAAVLSGAAWLGAATSAIGVILAKWCGEEFGLFDLGETLLRDIRSNFSKDFRFGEKISVKKTIKTGVMLTALGVAAVGVATAAWMGMMSLPFWPFVATKIGASAVSALQFATAGYFGFLGGLATLMGGSVGIRFFWGLGIWDKQIDFAKERQPKVITPKVLLNEKLAKLQAKFEAQAKNQGSKNGRQAGPNHVKEAFTHLRAAFKVSGKNAANEDERPVARRRARAH